MERSIEYFVAKKIETFRDRLEKENMNLLAENLKLERFLREKEADNFRITMAKQIL